MTKDGKEAKDRPIKTDDRRPGGSRQLFLKEGISIRGRLPTDRFNRLELKRNGRIEQVLHSKLQEGKR